MKSGIWGRDEREVGGGCVAELVRLGGGATFARRSRALGATSLMGGGAE